VTDVLVRARGGSFNDRTVFPWRHLFNYKRKLAQTHSIYSTRDESREEGKLVREREERLVREGGSTESI